MCLFSCAGFPGCRVVKYYRVSGDEITEVEAVRATFKSLLLPEGKFVPKKSARAQYYETERIAVGALLEKLGREYKSCTQRASVIQKLLRKHENRWA